MSYGFQSSGLQEAAEACSDLIHQLGAAEQSDSKADADSALQGMTNVKGMILTAGQNAHDSSFKDAANSAANFLEQAQASVGEIQNSLDDERINPGHGSQKSTREGLYSQAIALVANAQATLLTVANG